MYFSEDETRKLNERIHQLEKKTGIELLTAVVGKCDHYPEIPWKAFALGVAFSTAVILLQNMVRPDWISVYSAVFHAIVILGAGTMMALLTAFWPGWARCFLDKTRAEVETRQYAQSMFMERGLFATRDRTGILLLVGLFERQVVILPDSGVAAHLPSGALQTVADAVGTHLKRGSRFQALLQGIAVLDDHLQSAGFEPSTDDSDQIPGALIQRKGDADA